MVSEYWATGSLTRVPEPFKTSGWLRPSRHQEEVPPSGGRLSQAAGCQKAAKLEKAASGRADFLQEATREADT